MKTKYDWQKGARGSVLKPAGSASLQSLVFVISDGGALRELYERGGLYGVALEDARALYEEPSVDNRKESKQ